MMPRNAPWLFFGALSWCCLPVLGHDAPAVEVVAPHEPLPGGSDSAGQGVLGQAALAQAQALRPALLLEQIPGVVVTQHSGEGKANQYFVRGMNLDHGSDWLSTLDGVPLNLPSHAHGQGYTDLNFLMPELLQRIDYRKGPYGAAEGDFSSAGAAHIRTRSQLERPLLVLSEGQGGYQRALAAGSRALTPELQVLGALEQVRHNGPWTTPEGLRRDNALLSLSTVAGAQRWRLSLSSYAAHWTATDPVPQRLLQAGQWQGVPFGRYDSLDPSDGGATRRQGLTFNWQQLGEAQLQRLDLYALSYGLDLYSNFTYSLARSSDQFTQAEQRRAWGGHAVHSWWGPQETLPSWRHTLGLQFRQDRIHSALADSVSRQRLAAVREDVLQLNALGLYAQSDITWHPHWRTVFGLRADQLQTTVDSLLQPLNSGSAQASKLSPKLTVVWRLAAQTEAFASAGRGLHSNDARGTTLRVDPRSGAAVAPVPALVGTRGQELGLQAMWWAQAPTTLTLWRLDVEAERVYAGDAGTAFAMRPSQRVGLEWSQRWPLGRDWRLDAHGAWTRPRYTDAPAQDSAVVNAVQQVGRLHLQWQAPGAWSAALDWRHVGPTALTSDNSVRSAASQSLNLRVQQRTTPQLTLSLDVLNLANRPTSEIAYFYTSRLPGEPQAGVADVHLHPALPRSWRLTARYDH